MSAALPARRSETFDGWMVMADIRERMRITIGPRLELALFSEAGLPFSRAHLLKPARRRYEHSSQQ